MALTRAQVSMRLRELREALGLTQAAVAAKLGVHRPTISEIEAGRRAVTAEELYQLARLYGAPVSEILADSPAQDHEAADLLALRCDDADAPEARLALRRFIADRRSEYELEELLGLEHPVSAAIRREAPAPRSKMDAVEQGESLASLERLQLGLGAEPVASVLHILARQGVRIGPLRTLASDRIDGVYFESADLGPCVGVNWRDGDWTGGRAAFTAAHEYAHVILRDRTSEVFHLEPGERDFQEVRANAFAAAFLMPGDGITAYFAAKGLLRHHTLQHMAPADVVRAMDYFGVSRMALIYRLVNLRLINQELAKELAAFSVKDVARAAGIEFRDRKYIGTRLPELAIHAWRLGHISAGRAADLCDVDLQQFRDVMRTIGEHQQVEDDEPLLGAAATR